jgi:hypothetical protein
MNIAMFEGFGGRALSRRSETDSSLAQSPCYQRRLAVVGLLDIKICLMLGPGACDEACLLAF